MVGCLKSLIGKGTVLVLLVAAAYAGWRWGPQVFPRIQEWMDSRGGAGSEVVSSPELADSVLARVQGFRRGEGPAQLAFGDSELTSVLRYAVPELMPAGVVSPEVRLQEGRIHLRARVALAAFPDLPDLGPIVGILPDTLDVDVEASLMPFGAGKAALLVHSVEASRIPLPRRLVPQILTAMGRTDQPGLPPEALLVTLPSGLGSAYILTDSLFLSNDPYGPVPMAEILIVDDEESIGGALQQVFEYEGHRVRVARNGPDALALVDASPPDVTFLDVKMPGMDGLEVLERMRSQDPQALIIMISGHGTIDTAVEATRKGAYDFLEKPLDTDRLLVTLRNALELKGLSASVERLRSQVESRHQIVGSSFQIRQVLERTERVGSTEARVLITGENGTGKELVARAIHRLSSRSEGPFVEVNCAAIPSELIESELFGHIKGSFTGAVADRAGKFEQAHGGTLFLDEVGDMSLAAQAKVLRALEQGVVTRVGSSKPIQVDVRVVAATNKELDEEIREGRFREDLYYRLNVVPIEIPPLRERREDIPMLVRHFMDLLEKTDRVTPREISPGALARLQSLDWPGNVRELRNTVERLLILAAGPVIDTEDVNFLTSGGERGGSMGAELLQAGSFSDFKEQAERAYLLQKLRENDWNVSETARSVDMPRSNLYKKIEKYGLVRED